MADIDYVDDASRFAIAAITAGLAQSCQQCITREPLEEEPAHAVVFGRKTDGVKKRLAKAARWVSTEV